MCLLLSIGMYNEMFAGMSLFKNSFTQHNNNSSVNGLCLLSVLLLLDSSRPTDGQGK